MLFMTILVLTQAAELFDRLQRSSSEQWNYFYIDTYSIRGNLRVSLSSNLPTESVLAISSNLPVFSQDKESVSADYVDYNAWKLGYSTHWITVPDKYLQNHSNLTIGVGNPNQHYFTFQLILESSNSLLCPNDCSHQGICRNGKCKCLDNFIGYDCRVQATQLQNQKRYNYKLHTDSLAYCYFDITQHLQSLSIYLYAQGTDLIVSVDFSGNNLVDIPTEHIYSHQVLLTSQHTDQVIKLDRDTFKGNRLYLAVFNEDSNEGLISFLVYTEISFFNTHFGVYIAVLFAFLILSVIVLISAFRYTRDNHSPSSNNQVIGIPRDVIETQFPKMKYEKTNTAEISKCIICLEDFDCRDYIRKLKCGHVFHAHCIEEWLNMHIFCCLCKHDCSDNDTHVDTFKANKIINTNAFS